MSHKPQFSEMRDPNNPDRYLVTYADLITLLLGLFVILYATAQVDVGKYREFAAALGQYFKATPDSTLIGGGAILPAAKRTLPQPILPTAERRSLDQISQELEKTFQQQIQSNLIELERTPSQVRLRLRDKLLFESGKADLQVTAAAVLDSLATILAGLQKQIIVEGHTDNVPISTFRYPSNWHLSVDRALTVAYYLMQRGVPERFLTVCGYADQRPIASNATPEGRARNRRVEIVIEEPEANIPTTEGYIRSSITNKPAS